MASKDYDWSEIEAVYQASVVGAKPPHAFVASGRLVLAYRPDLEGTIDPGKSYYVTADRIVDVEDE